MAKKGLGRGFESLIPSDLFDETFDPTAEDDHKLSELRQLKLGDVVADPDQPRKRFDESALTELSESIKRHGVLQPIVVTPQGSGYQIIAGERRYRASKLAGIATIPALVRTTSAQQKLELSLIENLQRRNLRALETATAYAKLRDQFGLNLEQIGEAVGGKSVSAVSNTLRLLRLPKEVQKALNDGQITEGQSRPLIDFDEAKSLELLPKIINEQWSARRVEETVRQLKQSKKPAEEQPSATRRFIKQTEALSQRYKTNVKIQTSRSGQGKIVIDFKDEADLERITKTLL